MREARAALPPLLVLGVTFFLSGDSLRGCYSAVLRGRPPVAVFAGARHEHSNNFSGFAMTDDTTRWETFPDAVVSAVCLPERYVALATGSTLLYANPQWTKVEEVRLLDGPVLTMSAQHADKDPIDGVYYSGLIIGGLFPEALMFWDPPDVFRPVTTQRLEPPCVHTIVHAPRGLTGFVVGGCFMSINGEDEAMGVALLEPELDPLRPDTLRPLSVGVSGGGGVVFCLAAMETVLFVGGSFETTGDGSVHLGNIARYDAVTQVWTSLSGGVDGTIHTLAPHASRLFLGGTFCSLQNGGVCNLAVWSRDEGFQNVGFGVKGTVMTILTIGQYIAAGGRYITPDTHTHNMAVWAETPHGWESVGSVWMPPSLAARPGIPTTASLCPCTKGRRLDSGYCEEESELQEASRPLEPWSLPAVEATLERDLGASMWELIALVLALGAAVIGVAVWLRPPGAHPGSRIRVDFSAFSPGRPFVSTTRYGTISSNSDVGEGLTEL